MVLEYLFPNDELRSELEGLVPQNATIKFESIGSGDACIITYTIEGQNERSADSLSDIHDQIIGYTPQVLTCDSAAYYNRRLFPLVNDFECKLRRLLYLIVTISNDDKGRASCHALETNKLGTIFDLLFSDHGIIERLTKSINEIKKCFNGSNKYSKSLVQEYIANMTYEPLWDSMIGENVVPTLRQQCWDVQQYRNDVMHAHYIGKTVFNTAKKLFLKIIEELDAATREIAGEHTELQLVPAHDINDALLASFAALDVANIYRADEYLASIIESFHAPRYGGLPSLVSIFQDVTSKLNMISSSATLSGLQNSVSAIGKAFQMYVEDMVPGELKMKLAQLEQIVAQTQWNHSGMDETSNAEVSVPE